MKKRLLVIGSIIALALIAAGLFICFSIHKTIKEYYFGRKTANTVAAVATTTPGEADKTKKQEGIYAYAGTWHLVGSDQFNTGELTITPLTSTTFTFDLLVSSGSHTGGMGGEGPSVTATVLTPTTAHFLGEHGCELLFKLNGSSITLEDVEQVCATFYAGSGVSFDNTYTRQGREDHFSIGYYFSDTTREDSGFIQDPHAFTVFKNLVKDDILVFDDTAEVMMDATDDFGKGDINARVYIFHLPGLGSLSSIILIGPNDEMWAAVVSPDGKSIWYYTTEPDYKKVLPEAIEQWNGEDLPVIYRG